ncbi:ubiquitin-conjugating enzyme/RWD-like protein [Artemisia annua]|uniref:Ubiquitin-conjugating enzyme/RWD-like protein n=1 Tax=Artemisia annua TaxID=35608 RepID=A0A2U1MRL8_ARTAN|nr:ubiquitin-conjugating enzyme/RWD-like protein [Artemisia annua]
MVFERYCHVDGKKIQIMEHAPTKHTSRWDYGYKATLMEAYSNRGTNFGTIIKEQVVSVGDKVKQKEKCQAVPDEWYKLEIKKMCENFSRDYVLKRYRDFKKFDVVEDYSDHLIGAHLRQAKKIFVRAYKPMRELLRAVIIGAEGTPYHDRLFFFDVCMPGGYVTSFSPEHRVRYHWHHSDCLSINPHIYASGEVSLSLSRRARNGKIDWEEIWVPGTSNMLLLLHFEELVVGHFRSRVRHILTSCKSYMNDSSFLKGKKEERCSVEFRKDVASHIKPLVDAFIKIGAKEAHEFLYLCERKVPLLH